MNRVKQCLFHFLNCILFWLYKRDSKFVSVDDPSALDRILWVVLWCYVYFTDIIYLDYHGHIQLMIYKNSWTKYMCTEMALWRMDIHEPNWCEMLLRTEMQVLLSVCRHFQLICMIQMDVNHLFVYWMTDYGCLWTVSKNRLTDDRWLLGHCSNKRFGSCWYWYGSGRKLWVHINFIPLLCDVEDFFWIPGYLVSFGAMHWRALSLCLLRWVFYASVYVRTLLLCDILMFICTVSHPSIHHICNLLCFIPAHTCSVTLFCCVHSMLAAFC